MAYDNVGLVQSDTAAGLAVDLQAAVDDGKQPVGAMFVDPENGLLSWIVAEGGVSATFEDLDARVTAVELKATNLNTWAIDTATKANATNAKLNLDAGVTDTNYVVTFDTNPQA